MNSIKSIDDKNEPLDHHEQYFPINPATGSKVYTLNSETDPISVLYRYGIFGDDRFIDILPKLNSQAEYDEVIQRLKNKMHEIETWIGEHDDQEIDKGHMRRIIKIGLFIDKIKLIRNNFNNFNN